MPTLVHVQHNPEDHQSFPGLRRRLEKVSATNGHSTHIILQQSHRHAEESRRGLELEPTSEV